MYLDGLSQKWGEKKVQVIMSDIAGPWRLENNLHKI